MLLLSTQLRERNKRTKGIDTSLDSMKPSSSSGNFDVSAKHPRKRGRTADVLEQQDVIDVTDHDILQPPLEYIPPEQPRNEYVQQSKTKKERLDTTETQASSITQSKLQSNGSPSVASSGTAYTPQPSSKKEPNRYNKHLVVLQHACRCRDPHCAIVECPKMKALLQHLLKCTVAHCKVCRPLDMLLFVHSRVCREKPGDCVVPKCIPRNSLAGHHVVDANSTTTAQSSYADATSSAEFSNREAILGERRRLSSHGSDFLAAIQAHTVPRGVSQFMFPPHSAYMHPMGHGSYMEEYHNLLSPFAHPYSRPGTGSPTDQLMDAWSRATLGEFHR